MKSTELVYYLYERTCFLYGFFNEGQWQFGVKVRLDLLGINKVFLKDISVNIISYNPYLKKSLRKKTLISEIQNIVIIFWFSSKNSKFLNKSKLKTERGIISVNKNYQLDLNIS